MYGVHRTTTYILYVCYTRTACNIHAGPTPYSRAEGLTKKKHLLTLCRADWTRVDVKLTADPKAQVPNRRDVRRGAPVKYAVRCTEREHCMYSVQSTWSGGVNLVGRGSRSAPSSALLRAWCIDVMHVSPVLGQGGIDSKSQSSLVHENLAQLDTRCTDICTSLHALCCAVRTRDWTSQH